MKVSVALCTYNGEKFIRQQIESILGQSRLPDEIIICDDCSTDATPTLVEEIAARSNQRIKFLKNSSNLGSTRNFEKAISSCTGDLIFLADQDDVWAPEKVEEICKRFENDVRLGMVFTNASLIDESGKPFPGSLFDRSFQDRSGELFWSFLRKNPVTGATMAFRAEHSRAFMPIPIDIPNTIHDAWIALVIAANAEVMFLERNLIEYRQHPGQQLGLGLGAEHRSRSLGFEDSIAYHTREIERLEAMRRIIANDPRFSRENIQRNFALKVDEFVAEKHEIIRHYDARKNLPRNRLKRIIPVLAELKSGRYGKFSKGLASAAKDVFARLS